MPDCVHRRFARNDVIYGFTCVHCQRWVGDETYHRARLGPSAFNLRALLGPNRPFSAS